MPLTIKKAVHQLSRGSVIAFPTESSYGLAADATNAAAVESIYALKGRAPEKSLPLIVSSFNMAKRYGKFSPALWRLAKQYWPCALTLVVPALPGGGLSAGVVAADGTLALRMSAHPIARSLARRLKKPIVSTSANRSGAPACYSISDLKRQLNLSDGQFIDGGLLVKNAPSTIVAEKNGDLIVLREGSVLVQKENRPKVAMGGR